MCTPAMTWPGIRCPRVVVSDEHSWPTRTFQSLEQRLDRVNPLALPSSSLPRYRTAQLSIPYYVMLWDSCIRLGEREHGDALSRNASNSQRPRSPTVHAYSAEVKFANDVAGCRII
jgi:hypothetical protein